MTFAELQKDCDKFNTAHPDKDEYFAFVAPLDDKAHYLFLEYWNESGGANPGELKNGQFIMKTDYVKLPLEACVTTEEALKRSLNDLSVYITKLGEFIKVHPY